MLSLEYNLEHILIRDKDADEDKQRESGNMGNMFDPDCNSAFLEENPDRLMDAEEGESSPVECWEGEEIEHSEIDTDNSGNEGNDRNGYLGVYEIHEKVPDCNRSSEAFNRFGPIAWYFWSKNPGNEISEKLEGHE